ncbi:MAG: hypothetical protein Q9181_005183 [Wetmoreana brouardii]
MTDVLGTYDKGPITTASGSARDNGSYRRPDSIHIHDDADEQENLQSAMDNGGKFRRRIRETSETHNQPTTYQGNAESQGHGTLNGKHEWDGGSQDSEPETRPKGKTLKLTPAQIHELTSSPDSLPLAAPAIDARITLDLNGDEQSKSQGSEYSPPKDILPNSYTHHPYQSDYSKTPRRTEQGWDNWGKPSISTRTRSESVHVDPMDLGNSQTIPTPSLSRRNSSKVSLSAHKKIPSSRKNSKSTPRPLHFDAAKLGHKHATVDGDIPSPMPQTIPIPPYSLPTYLQLELSSHKPSPLYIHRSRTSDFPYESSRVKMERLQNFLGVPQTLEGVLWFGFFACLDAWLFSFTILPLRFIKALALLMKSMARNVWAELKFIGLSLYFGPGRLWQRRRASSAASPARPSFPNIAPPTPQNPLPHSPSPRSPQFQFPAENEYSQPEQSRPEPSRRRRKDAYRKHRRAKSTPSELGPGHKADIVKGFLILFSCLILLQFDASRMYHGIRGQAAIKLYVIYNVLEVCDRLFSALGQDILECLISKEALERKPDGRSKIMRPLWLFILALGYNLAHSTALFYQVITLNVAVNSYSNALLTLLLSNQFVEIKSTVFKKFEKENLFQLTCADVVERFQLWLMLTIIALRNVIETGGLGLSSSIASTSTSGPASTNILPKVFTMFPDWFGNLTHLWPFVLVLGSEAGVDWLKHCYITKFNNTKPAIYSRFHDILAKDYYSNAFADQNLTRRLGLPVIPLSCLFIRASVQTYHMFLATYLPPPITSTTTSLTVDSATTSPATTAALQHIDHIFRRALGRSTFGAASSSDSPLSQLYPKTWLHQAWSSDDIIALLIMTSFFLILFLVLLASKLILGMCLLRWARGRYKGMKERERDSVHAEGRRVGGWGVVEVDEDKKRWIYEGDPEGIRRAKEREMVAKERERGIEEAGGGFEKVSRYSMVAKRIW